MNDSTNKSIISQLNNKLDGLINELTVPINQSSVNCHTQLNNKLDGLINELTVPINKLNNKSNDQSVE